MINLCDMSKQGFLCVIPKSVAKPDRYINKQLKQVGNILQLSSHKAQI